MGHWAKKIIVRWSETQSIDLAKQLVAGIRYFDMRPGYLRDRDDFYVVHGLYGHPINSLLLDLHTFLKAHPKEVVILDFNHFYNFTDDLHGRMVEMIQRYFDNMLICPQRLGPNASLKDIWECRKQVVIIYNNNSVVNEFPMFWSKSYLYSPWANTNKTEELLYSLIERFDTIKPDALNVFQAILSPQPSEMPRHFKSSLKNYLCIKCNSATCAWLENVYKDKRGGVNIVIFDFIDIDNCVKLTIKLNLLLKNERSRDL